MSASISSVFGLLVSSGTESSCPIIRREHLDIELITDPIVKELVQAGESEVASLSDWERANFREIKRLWNKTQCVDADLVFGIINVRRDFFRPNALLEIKEAKTP